MRDVITASNRAYVSNVPAAPGNNATVVLLATHPRLTGGSGAQVQSVYTRANGRQVIIAPDAIEQVDIVFHAHDKASAANGIRLYVTLDRGATWFESDYKSAANVATLGALQVPVLAAGAEFVVSFAALSRYKGFAIEYTAGAAGPTAVTGWNVTVALTCKDA